VTNQCIGEGGLDLIAQLLERGDLSELLFDGAAVRSFDYLARFCESILASRLRFASFPVQDCERLFRLLPAGEDLAQLAERRDDLRRRFERLYGDPIDRGERVRQISASATARRPSDLRSRVVRQLSRSRSATDADLQLPESLAAARRMSERQAALFLECIDPDDDTEDPMLLLMQTIQDNLTLSSIISGPP
jgi:hypothetical protein